MLTECDTFDTKKKAPSSRRRRLGATAAGLLIGMAALARPMAGADAAAANFASAAEASLVPTHPCVPGACAYELNDMTTFDRLAAKVRVGGGEQKVIKIAYRRNIGRDGRGDGTGDVYFMDTKRFEFHFDFVAQAVPGFEGARPETFNVNYKGGGETRAFNLASLILFPGAEGTPGSLLLEMWSGDEIAGDPLMELFRQVRSRLSLGELPVIFHPTSIPLENAAKNTSTPLPIVTTEELFAGRDFLALNEGEALGYARIIREGEEAPCMDHSNIAVFERVPNEIGMVGAVITEEFQTPLSHVNVKSMNRGTANLFLKKALRRFAAEDLQPEIPGKGLPVKLVVKAGEYVVERLQGTPEEIDRQISRFWGAQRPDINVRPESIYVAENSTRFLELANLWPATELRRGLPTREAHKRTMQMIGAKATNIGLLSLILNDNVRKTLGATSPKGYGIPFNFYEKPVDDRRLPVADDPLCTYLTPTCWVNRITYPECDDTDPTCPFMNLRQAGLDPDHLDRIVSPGRLVRENLLRAGLMEERLHSICQAGTALERIRAMVGKAKIPAGTMTQFKKILAPYDVADSEVQRNSPVAQCGQRVLAADGTASCAKPVTTRIRLRSSTNSEDLEGFNGAGLYTSEGVSLFSKDDNDIPQSNKPKTWAKIQKDIAEKLPIVYASVWNDRAFEEREWYGLYGSKHLDVKVGIAIHNAFPDKELDGRPGELANGVSLTMNMYTGQEAETVYINGQHYDLAVTNPPTAEELVQLNEDPTKPYKTEEVMVTTMLPVWDDNFRPNAWKNWSYDILGRTSIKDGEPVLQDDVASRELLKDLETRRLARVMNIVGESCRQLYAPRRETFPIDVEWKIYGTGKEQTPSGPVEYRQLILKQVRPLARAPAVGSGRAAAANNARSDAAAPAPSLMAPEAGALAPQAPIRLGPKMQLPPERALP